VLRRSARALAFLATLLASAGSAPNLWAAAGTLTAKELAQGYRDGVVVAKPRPELVPTIDGVERGEGMTVAARYPRFGQIGVLRLAPGESVTEAIRRLQATGRYLYVEPDLVRHTTVVPNDPSFPNQWALNNTGANAGGGGIAGADIHAEAAWGVLTGAPNVIVGILDSGALLTHQDLAANLWINPTGGGKSATYNDGSGSVTDTDALNGLNAVAGSGDPSDDVGHGTHVSGIVGAVGNNSVGVTGVAWQVQLMELKFIDSTGSGTTTAELPCIEYAIANKASVINGSFGSASPSQAEMDAIQSAGKAGIVFVCAAGNNDEDNDISDFFPANYPLDNILTVGASDNRDLPAVFSNYGSGSVDLFAPGETVYSTWNSSTSAYQYEDGTSMASPFVAGAAALLRALYPKDTYRETINRVLNCVDKIPAMAGKCQTGGRLNLDTALTTAGSTAPNALFANRIMLAGLDPYTRTSNADTPSALEAGTPTIPGGPGTHSLWWSWTATENASVEVDTSGTDGGTFLTGGSTYPTLLGVYTGSSLGSLSAVGTQVTGLTEPLEGGGGSVAYSEVKFEAVAGTTYQFNVESQDGSTGQTVLAINADPDNDSESTPRTITGRSVNLVDANLNATRQSGEPIIGGDAGGHSLWYAWTAPYTGTTQITVYSYEFNPDVAVYTGTSLTSLALVDAAESSSIIGTTTAASAATATFAATQGTTYLIQVDGRTSSDVGGFVLTLDDSLWQGVTQDAITCSPAVGSDGSVYVGSNDDNFYAFSPGGTLKWKKAGSAPFDTSSAAIGTDGTIYAGCEDGNLYALNPSSGATTWTFAFPSSQVASSSPALGSDGTIYIKGSDGTNGALYAISSSGAQKWAFSIPGQSYAAPTLAPDGTIYIGTDEGHLYAVNPDGSQKWVFTTPVSGEQIYTAAAIDAQGNLYLGTLAGNFYSLTAAGSRRWTYALGNGVTSAPALANGAVYFGAYDGNLYSLSTAGALNWKYPLGTQVRACGPAVDANGVIYIGCYDHNLYAVSSAGALVRTYATADVIRSSPSLANQTLTFGSSDHKLYAFSLPAGLAASDWPMYQHDPLRTGRSESSTLEITTQPSALAVSIGSAFTLTVGASGPGTLTYQWLLGGSPIAGATGASYSVAAATAANAGTYTVTVTSGGTSVTSAAVTVTVSAATSGHLVNLSARANVGTGSNILIAGFVIGGSGSKSMLLRGIGPALAAAPFNVSGALAQPQLTLIDTATNTTVTTGTAWGGTAALQDAFTAVGAFSLPTGSADAAVLETLSAGTYTSEVAGVDGTQGVALAEIYDADPNSTSASLLNISARADVGTGANILIAGFVIEGSQPAQVLLRGIGPTLAAAPFNITGALTQPQIQLVDSAGNVLQTNAGWGGTTALQSAFTQVGAFTLPTGSADAAMLATLPAGNYTLELSGLNGTTGVGLIEVYLVP
jgi:outer membrane protein assembly factor BamB/subtilisin family serine protease